MNLVGDLDEAAVWDRHVLDCLQLAPLMNERPGSAIDMGSGAGFPGLVLAIATGRMIHLVEADQRKAAFLREAARLTQAPVTIHPIRIESARLPTPAIIMARALAPLPLLLAYAERFAGPETTCLFLKGAKLQGELTAAENEWHMDYVLHPSITAPDAAILEVREFSRAPAR